MLFCNLGSVGDLDQEDASNRHSKEENHQPEVTGHVREPRARDNLGHEVGGHESCEVPEEDVRKGAARLAKDELEKKGHATRGSEDACRTEQDLHELVIWFRDVLLSDEECADSRRCRGEEQDCVSCDLHLFAERRR